MQHTKLGPLFAILVISAALIQSFPDSPIPGSGSGPGSLASEYPDGIVKYDPKGVKCHPTCWKSQGESHLKRKWGEEGERCSYERECCSCRCDILRKMSEVKVCVNRYMDDDYEESANCFLWNPNCTMGGAPA